jgi:multiple sugar transport system substrate-binding protein
MTDIELSLMSNVYTADSLEKSLQELASQTGVKYHSQFLTWGNAWTELVRVALYGHGPDVSEIGTTWVGDLVGMNSLHPFSHAEIDTIGGADTYLKGAWQSGLVGQDNQVWSIPWLADTRLIYYRRDLLAKAGISEAGAFASHAAIKDTMQKLVDFGIPLPLIIPTTASRMCLQVLASYVWGAGGDFIDLEGKKTLLNLPQTRTGFYQYFELGKYLIPAANNIVDNDSDVMYRENDAAVTFSGPWMLRYPGTNPNVIKNTGITFPPGVPFVGGTNLVVWKHSRNTREALSLIRMLTSKKEQIFYSHSIGMLPVRQDVLSDPETASDPLYKALSLGFQRGRSFRMFHLWGLVEDRLTNVIGSIWQELLLNPESDLQAVVDKRLSALARQLDLVLSSK